MHHGIDKHEGIAGFEMNFDGSRRKTFLLPMGLGQNLRMLEIGLVAAGNNHRAPITRPHIRQCEKNIDLGATKTPVDHAELVPDDPILTSRVHREKSSSPADRGKTFIDKQSFHIGVFLAAISLEAIDP